MSNTNTSRVHVLAITPVDSDVQALARIFSHTAWDFSSATNLSDALATMHDAPAPVVLTETNLPDANWKDVLSAMSTQPNPPYIVVASSAADDLLWAEALNLGAYDVIAKPFRPHEVFRVVGLAWRHWIDVHRARPAAKATAAAAPTRSLENCSLR
jgi:DNA-binding NtrC family response regulator